MDVHVVVLDSSNDPISILIPVLIPQVAIHLQNVSCQALVPGVARRLFLDLFLFLFLDDLSRGVQPVGETSVLGTTEVETPVEATTNPGETGPRHVPCPVEALSENSEEPFDQVQCPFTQLQGNHTASGSDSHEPNHQSPAHVEHRSDDPVKDQVPCELHEADGISPCSLEDARHEAPLLTEVEVRTTEGPNLTVLEVTFELSGDLLHFDAVIEQEVPEQADVTFHRRPHGPGEGHDSEQEARKRDGEQRIGSADSVGVQARHEPAIDCRHDNLLIIVVTPEGATLTS